MDTWPGTLPQRLLVDGYSRGSADGRLVSQMDAGPPQIRRRTTAAVRPLRGSMILTLAQQVILDTFVQDTLLGGSLPFKFPKQPWDGVTYVRVMFGQELPSDSNMGGDNWPVTLDLLILPDLP